MRKPQGRIGIRVRPCDGSLGRIVNEVGEGGCGRGGGPCFRPPLPRVAHALDALLLPLLPPLLPDLPALLVRVAHRPQVHRRDLVHRAGDGGGGGRGGGEKERREDEGETKKRRRLRDQRP